MAITDSYLQFVQCVVLYVVSFCGVVCCLALFCAAVRLFCFVVCLFRFVLCCCAFVSLCVVPCCFVFFAFSFLSFFPAWCVDTKVYEKPEPVYSPVCPFDKTPRPLFHLCFQWICQAWM
eukprot:scpid95103/ scgid23515/ 